MCHVLFTVVGQQKTRRARRIGGFVEAFKANQSSVSYTRTIAAARRDFSRFRLDRFRVATRQTSFMADQNRSAAQLAASRDPGVSASPAVGWTHPATQRAVRN
jgi:hypothetical protein